MPAGSDHYQMPANLLGMDSNSPPGTSNLSVRDWGLTGGGGIGPNQCYINLCNSVTISSKILKNMSEISAVW